MNAEEFKNWRRNRYSQFEAARLLGTSPTSISHYENGNWPIPQAIEDKCRSLSTERNPTVREFIDWMIDNGLSQSDAAAHLDMSVSTIQRFIHGVDIDKVLTPRMAVRMKHVDLTRVLPARPPLYMYGRQLADDEKGWALQLCPNRYTGEWTPPRVYQRSKVYMLEFETDADFLRQSIFRVHQNGTVKRNQKAIICVPDWPGHEYRIVTHPVVVLHCSRDTGPTNKARGQDIFVNRFNEEWLKVKARNAEMAGLTLSKDDFPLIQNNPAMHWKTKRKIFNEWWADNALNAASAATYLGCGETEAWLWSNGQKVIPDEVMTAIARYKASAPTPRYETAPSNLSDAELRARHLDQIRERQRIALGIKITPAPLASGIDLNDSPSDPPADPESDHS